MRRIDLQATDGSTANARDVAVAALHGAGKIVLPTETVYGIAAKPVYASVLRDFKARPDQQPFTHHLDDAQRVLDELPPAAQRLAHCFWPGPLTMIVPDARVAGHSIGYRVPDHPFTRDVIAACGGDLLMSSVNGPGRPPLLTADAIGSAYGDQLDVLIGDREMEEGERLASTVVQIPSDAPLKILRQGEIDDSDILHAAARKIVFVCTGNTCRSPLAAVIARQQLAEQLGVPEINLLEHGFHVLSGGIAAGFGSPASEGSRTVAEEIGLTLNNHRSQPVTPTMLEGAEAVFCMSPSHVSAIVDYLPELRDIVTLLDPAGVPDPYGADVPVYRQTREHLLSVIEARVRAIVGATQ